MRLCSLLLLLFAVAVPAQQWTALDGPRAIDRFSAYDTHRGRLVMFSGGGETFEYDGNQLLHRPVLTGTPVPPPRWRASMVYDELRRHVLLFGGRSLSAPGVVGGTWAFDGNAWRQFATGPQPVARSEPGFAYDALRGRTVMIGGQFFSSTIDPDTWEHDGSQWQSRGPAGPTNVGSATMAYDRGRGVTVLFQNSAFLGQAGTTWEWNGLVWLQRTTATAPQVSGNMSMAYDALRQRTVLLGGGANGDGIWEWNGNAWTRVATMTARRMDPALWFDPALGKLVLAGGTDVQMSGSTTIQGSARTDAWTWDGATMAPLRGDRRPLSRYGHAWFADVIRERWVLFGGLNANDTWTWDGNTWTERTPTNRPPARTYPAATFDWTAGVGLVFGGAVGAQMLGDLWVWNGTDWSLRPTTGGPSARMGAAMSYDLIRNLTVLFGGVAGVLPAGLRNDTWEWTGTAWLQRVPAVSPSPRDSPAMTFDLLRNRTVLFGGRVGGTAADQLADTWEWDGSIWQQVTPAGGPPALLQPSLSYDPSRLRVVLTGTEFLGPGQAATFHTWDYDGSSWTRVAALGGDPVTGPCALLPSSGRVACAPLVALYEWSATRAAVDDVGAGCGAPAPVLAVRARPRLGEAACGLDCWSATGLPTVLALAVAPANLPLGNGCTAWIGQAAATLFTVAGPTGLATMALPIPRAYGLRGLPVFAQAAVFDGGSPGGVSLSQALRLQVGD